MRTIAIDAMGGENAPKAIIEAILKVKSELPKTKFVLFGQEQELRSELKDELASPQIEIVASQSVISDEEEPVKAIRRKKDSSMVMAANYVKAGKADALFSMGNTGALLAAGIFIIGRIKGIARPALMPTLPAANSKVGFNIIDVGANAQSKPDYLLQWAEMAAYYAQKIRGIDQPKVALLNNGAESDKGDQLHQEVYQLLAKSQLHFTGNIEGNEIMTGKADVVVCDGFSGNIALKSVEGMASVLLHSLKDSLLTNGIWTKLGALMIKNAVADLRDKYDTARYGGAVLLGLKAPVVKTHGRSDQRPIYYTLKQIDKILAEELVTDFQKQFGQD
jgi:glycerol-3-phosphate acyltransferase PlsX